MSEKQIYQDDFYASWKQQAGYETAKQEAWKSDLRIGQKVKAAQDIEWSEVSMRYVANDTPGVVVAMGLHYQTWGIKFKGKRDVWYVIYDPKALIEDDGWCWESEIVVIEEPDPPAVPPEAYVGELL